MWVRKIKFYEQPENNPKLLYAWSLVSITFVAHWSSTRSRKYCPIVHKNSENLKFQCAINLCNHWNESTSHPPLRIVNNFMNNHEHFEQRSIAVKTNYRNKHNTQGDSVPIASQVRKINMSRLFMVFQGMFMKCS